MFLHVSNVVACLFPMFLCHYRLQLLSTLNKINKIPKALLLIDDLSYQQLDGNRNFGPGKVELEIDQLVQTALNLNKDIHTQRR